MPDERGYLPRVYRDLRAEQPKVARAYDALGRACSDAGPLNEREQHLVKLGIAIGLSSEGGVRSHVRRGLMEGISAEELLPTRSQSRSRPRASRRQRQRIDGLRSLEAPRDKDGG